MEWSPNCTPLGSLTGQKCEKETEVSISPHSHRQVVFSLLYNHSSALVPHTTVKLWTSAVLDYKRCCCSFHHAAFPSCCPAVLHNYFFPPSPTCFSFMPDFQPSAQCWHCNISMHRMEWCKGRRKQLGSFLHPLFQPCLFTFGAYDEQVMLQNKKHFQTQVALMFFLMC